MRFASQALQTDYRELPACWRCRPTVAATLGYPRLGFQPSYQYDYRQMSDKQVVNARVYYRNFVYLDSHLSKPQNVFAEVHLKGFTTISLISGTTSGDPKSVLGRRNPRDFRTIQIKASLVVNSPDNCDIRGSCVFFTRIGPTDPILSKCLWPDLSILRLGYISPC